MQENNDKEFVAVKLEGPFTEWYSPYFKDPFNDNAEYRKYYEEHIIDQKPVIGPALGDDDDAYICDDLQYTAERYMSGCNNWGKETDNLISQIERALESGVTCTYISDIGETIKITPYRKSELPPVNEESLKVYGPYSELIRERVAAI